MRGDALDTLRAHELECRRLAEDSSGRKTWATPRRDPAGRLGRAYGSEG
jgi:hypothetical protein